MVKYNYLYWIIYLAQFGCITKIVPYVKIFSDYVPCNLTCFHMMIYEKVIPILLDVHSLYV